MRKLLIMSVLVLGLVACDKEKDKTDTPVTDASVTDSAASDSVAEPDAVTPSTDVTESVDVTATSPADVTVTD